MNGHHSSHEVVTSSMIFSRSNNQLRMPRKNNREMVGGCCVCSDERGWDENPLVYCDGQGCNVAVHQGKICEFHGRHNFFSMAKNSADCFLFSSSYGGYHFGIF